MNRVAWLVFIAAAVLEVAGDAVVRHGLRSRRPLYIAGGMLALGLYGLVVNSVRWDFSKLMGVYIAFFALVSALFGQFYLREEVPVSTWLGTGVVIAGAMIIQFGRR